MTTSSNRATGAGGNLREVALLFLRLGFTAFGGPAAHIAMMRQEVVHRRKWLGDQDFLDLLGATNLIPGPNSTEMAIHLGYRRAGWPGLLAGGALFILPAMLLVLGFAWAYVRYGSTPQVEWLLYGVKPVIIAIVVHALWGLSRTAIKGLLTALVGAAVLALYLLGFNELALLFGGGAVVLAVKQGWQLRQRAASMGLLALPATALPGLAAAAAVPFSMATLFLNFLKVGSVLYGSGYVLLAFLRSDFVERLGWLTDQQLIDTIAVGQFTPGPVFTTATFVGYLVGGWPGAIVATVGIFLPAFVFVGLLTRVMHLARRSGPVGAFLDGVNVAALGLMAAVSYQLGRAALVDPFTVALGLVALLIMVRARLNSAWLVLGGGVLGIAYKLAVA